jgi:hypothetical protein
VLGYDLGLFIVEIKADLSSPVDFVGLNLPVVEISVLNVIH